jgi:hypothetical protein
MVFFDRSCYNRTGVERVMEFCTPSEYLKFLRQCPSLERMIVNYAASQAFGALLKTQDSNGLLFPSVRAPKGLCLGIFRP